MIDDEQAFLRAAAADPDDDTLRLAYADWLDEQGGETFATQAEFVRLQVRRSRMDVFDPDRVRVRRAEAALLRKYRRAWNGRVHRRLHQLGFPGKVDARTGLLREWDYHRGMIARATVSAEGAAAHLDTVLAIGPVRSLTLVGWPQTGWTSEDRRVFRQRLPRLALVSIVGSRAITWVPDLSRLAGLESVPLLDLRAFGSRCHPDRLLRLAGSGSISPVVLFRRTVLTRRSRTIRGVEYAFTESARDESHVIDPFGKWDGLRAGFADLTGEVLTPIPYHGTSR